MSFDSRIRGYLSIFIAAFFWGAASTAAKFLFLHDIPPMLVVQSRVVIAAIFMAVMVLVTDRKHLSISIRDLKDFALLGIFGVAGSNYTYYMAIQVTSVGIAILMQYTAPAMVAIYVLLAKQERVSKVKALAVFLSLGGSMIMLGAFDPRMHISALGIFFGIASAVCFAFFNVYNKVASKHYTIWTAVTWTLIFGGSFWLILDLIVGPKTFNIGMIGLSEAGVLTAFSFSSILIPYFFYFTGLKHLSPSTAIIVATLEPVVAIVSSFIVLGEALSLSQIAGGILIVSAVILLEVRRE